MKSSTSEPNESITPFCMPRPKPNSMMSMNMPQKTPNAVNSVRSLFCRRVNRISCRPSNMPIRSGHRALRSGLPSRHDQPVFQENVPLSLVSDVLLVSHDDECVAAPVDILDERHDLPRGVAVEGTRWLIGEDHLGLTHQGTRNGDALLLAS